MDSSVESGKLPTLQYPDKLFSQLKFVKSRLICSASVSEAEAAARCGGPAAETASSWSIVDNSEIPIGSTVLSINGVSLSGLDKDFQTALIKQKKRPMCVSTEEWAKRAGDAREDGDSACVPHALLNEKYMSSANAKTRRQVRVCLSRCFVLCTTGC